MYIMDLDTVPSRLSDDFGTQHRFAFRAKIVIDQRITIYDHHKGMCPLFLGDRNFCTDNFFMSSAPNFRVYFFYQSRKGLFLVKNTQQYSFNLFFGILFADKISLGSQGSQTQRLQVIIEVARHLFEDIIFLLCLEEFCQIVFRSGSMEKFQPMFIGGISVFERIDIDDITHLRSETDGFDLSIDESVFEPQSDIRMDSKSKIQYGAAHRKFNHIALWSIKENTFIQDFDA
jgi:hypothetical protein